MLYQELTDKIIGSAYKVYNTMGFGFAEKVYENCMMIELRKRGIKAEAQVPIVVYYEEEVVGDYIADILVEGKVILELKAVRKIKVPHEVQTVNYLAATHLEIGLIINFAEKSVQIKRKKRRLYD